MKMQPSPELCLSCNIYDSFSNGAVKLIGGTHKVEAFLFLKGARNCSIVGATFCRGFELLEILRVD